MIFILTDLLHFLTQFSHIPHEDPLALSHTLLEKVAFHLFCDPSLTFLDDSALKAVEDGLGEKIKTNIELALLLSEPVIGVFHTTHVSDLILSVVHKAVASRLCLSHHEPPTCFGIILLYFL